MKVTTEALNNPKMLKLYSWQNNFVRRIMRKRQQEVMQIKRQGYAVSWLVACIYFWPNLLPVVVFTTYIFFGNYLTLDVAVASLILFNKMRSPMIELPWFLKSFLEMMVSNRRIQKYLLCDEVQPSIFKRVPEPTDDGTVLAVSGNFSWGFKEKGKKKDDDKKKKDEKKEKKKA